MALLGLHAELDRAEAEGDRAAARAAALAVAQAGAGVNIQVVERAMAIAGGVVAWAEAVVDGAVVREAAECAALWVARRCIDSGMEVALRPTVLVEPKGIAELLQAVRCIEGGVGGAVERVAAGAQPAAMLLAKAASVSGEAEQRLVALEGAPAVLADALRRATGDSWRLLLCLAVAFLLADPGSRPAVVAQLRSASLPEVLARALPLLGAPPLAALRRSTKAEAAVAAVMARFEAALDKSGLLARDKAPIHRVRLLSEALAALADPSGLLMGLAEDQAAEELRTLLAGTGERSALLLKPLQADLESNPETLIPSLFQGPSQDQALVPLLHAVAFSVLAGGAMPTDLLRRLVSGTEVSAAALRPLADWQQCTLLLPVAKAILAPSAPIFEAISFTMSLDSPRQQALSSPRARFKGTSNI